MSEIITKAFIYDDNYFANVKDFLNDEMGIACSLSDDNTTLIVDISENLRVTSAKTNTSSSSRGITYSIYINGEVKVTSSSNYTIESNKWVYVSAIKKSDSEYAFGFSSASTTTSLEVFVSTATSVDKTETIPCIAMISADRQYTWRLCEKSSNIGSFMIPYVQNTNVVQLSQLALQHCGYICENLYREIEGIHMNAGKVQIGGKTFACSGGFNSNISKYTPIFLKLD